MRTALLFIAASLAATGLAPGSADAGARPAADARPFNDTACRGRLSEPGIAYVSPGISEGRASPWDPKGEWRLMSPDDHGCELEDTVGLLTRGQRPTWMRADERLVFFGDSLDRNAIEYLCNTAKLKRHVPLAFEAWEKAHHLACHGASFKISNVLSFGVVRPCQTHLLQKYSAKLIDARKRILKYVVDRPEKPTMLVLHSCLWDLSLPCTTGRRPSRAFVAAYARAIRNLTTDLAAALPETLITWRTCPPVSSVSDRGEQTPKGKAKGDPPNFTRTRQGQAILNAAMRAAVARMHRDGALRFGSPVDYDAMIQSNYDRIDKEVAFDGIHYGQLPSLAYLNMIFNMLRAHRVDGDAAPP